MKSFFAQGSKKIFCGRRARRNKRCCGKSKGQGPNLQNREACKTPSCKAAECRTLRKAAEWNPFMQGGVQNPFMQGGGAESFMQGGGMQNPSCKAEVCKTR